MTPERQGSHAHSQKIASHSHCISAFVLGRIELVSLFLFHSLGLYVKLALYLVLGLLGHLLLQLLHLKLSVLFLLLPCYQLHMLLLENIFLSLEYPLLLLLSNLG